MGRLSHIRSSSSTAQDAIERCTVHLPLGVRPQADPESINP